jgi:hypothetical protein
VSDHICTSPDSPTVVLPISKLLTIERCPSEWRRHDLYLFRDDAVVFYVGQSYNAFERVWAHLYGGFKGRSVVGRFVLYNWPRSMRFVVELMHSQSARFDPLGNDLDAAERYLIEQLSPCFNEAWNSHPTPLPDEYAPPSARGRRPKSIKRMMHAAARACQLEEDRKQW